MNFGVFGELDWSISELNCAENMKIAKAFDTFVPGGFSPQVYNNSDLLHNNSDL